jgi:hypothetical protein
VCLWLFVCIRFDYNRGMKKKTTKLSLNPFSLLRDTLQDFRSHFVKILIISAVVAIPGSLLRVATIDNGVTDFSIVASIAGLYTSLALFYAFYNIKQLNKNSWSKTYVAASGRFLPYLGVTILQGLLALIAVLGLLLPVLVFSGVVAPAFGIFGVAIGLIALWVLLRVSLAAVITITTEFGVNSSLRASWLGTKKLVLRLLLDWVVVLLLGVIISGLILTAVYAVPPLANSQLAVALINGVLVTFSLPIVIGYTVHIWNRIQQA